MKNPLNPAIELTIEDPVKGGCVAFNLEFTFESIAVAEDITDKALLTGLTRRDVGHPKISMVRAMLFAALLPTEPEITYAEAAAFVTKDTLILIWGKVLDAWNAAMREEKDDAPADPTIARS